MQCLLTPNLVTLILISDFENPQSEYFASVGDVASFLISQS